MAVVTNREVLQSYIITTAKYDFSIYEKRILYRQIEIEQELLEGKGEKVKSGAKIDTTLLGDRYYTIPVHWLLPNGEQDKNHYQVKKAFNSLMRKIINYDDKEKALGFPLIKEYLIDKKGETVRWQCHSMIVEAIVNFVKGYRKYELKTAMEFKSIYAMRIYELISGQESLPPFKIETLKAMFMLENKYKDTNRFVSKVIDVAKKELDEKSPYTFDYKINKQGKKFHSIKFYPKYQPQHSDENIESKNLQKQVSVHWDLSRETIKYLKENFGFDNESISKHREIFKLAEQEFDLLVVLARLKRYTEKMNNPIGYVVNSVKKELAKFEGKRNAEEKTQVPAEPTAAAAPSPADMIKNLAKSFNQNK